MAKPYYLTVVKDPVVDGYFSFELKLGDEGKEQLKAKNRYENLDAFIFKALEDLGAQNCHTENDIWVKGAFAAEGRNSADARLFVQQAWGRVLDGTTELNHNTALRNAAAGEAYETLYKDAQKVRRDEYKFFHDYRTPPINVGGPFPHISINAIQPQKAGSLQYSEEEEMRRRGLSVRDLKKEDALVVRIEIEHPDERALRALCAKAVSVKPKNDELSIQFGEASRRDPEAFRMTAVMRRNDFNALLVELGKALNLPIPRLIAGAHSEWGDVKLKEPVKPMKAVTLVRKPDAVN